MHACTEGAEGQRRKLAGVRLEVQRSGSFTSTEGSFTFAPGDFFKLVNLYDLL